MHGSSELFKYSLSFETSLNKVESVYLESTFDVVWCIEVMNIHFFVDNIFRQFAFVFVFGVISLLLMSNRSQLFSIR